MVTARRVGRWVLYGLGGCLVLVVLVRAGVGAYLSTPAGKAMVARKIGAQIGMPVEVTKVRVGLFTSSIGLRIFDPGAPDASKLEVFAVEKVDADVSLFDLATSSVEPSKVTLRGANLTLHVSADGKVLTTLPKSPAGTGTGALPAITLTDTRLTIRQDGRPEFALQNLDLTVEPGGDRVKLSGTIDDPNWSKWRVTGDIAREGKTGSVELATDDGPLTMDRLGSIPFVPDSVWRRVKPNGRGAVAVRLWTDSTGEPHYAVDIKPNAAALTIPDADVTLERVTGHIAVSGAKVTLAGTRAELAGGSITAAGVLDFAPEPTVMTLKVTADKLDINRLPAEWKLPKDFEGKLKGTADLTLRVFADGRVEPDGGGEGAITDVKLLGFPGDDIPIRLRKTGNQYEFQQPKQVGRALPANDPRFIALPSVPTAANSVGLLRAVTFLTPQGSDSLARGIAPGTRSDLSSSLKGWDSALSHPFRVLAINLPLPGALPRARLSDPCGVKTAQPTTPRARPSRAPVMCSAPAQEKKPADPPAKDPPPKKDSPTTLDATIRLRDIDIAELLAKLNVKLGYKVSGKVTAEASVVVPVGGVTSQAAYQFSGKLSSPALTLEGLTIRDLAAHMTYQDGKFTLTDLSGKIDQPGKEGAPGTFRGTLTAMTNPPGDVTADLTIDRIPLGEVLKALPDFKLAARGTVAGKVSVKAPYAKLSDPAEWVGSGELTSSELVVEGRSAKDIKLTAAVAKGVVSLKEAKVTLEGIPVTAEATLTLSDKYPFTATVRTTGTDVTDLRKLVPEVELPAPVEGVLETETTVKGTASPLTYTATGTIKASKLTLAKSSANHVEAKWELTPEKLVVSELKADAFGGSLTGSADVPLVPEKGGSFRVAFKSLDAAAATELVPDFPVKIAGKVSGTVAGTIPPAGKGQARVGNLDVDITAPKLTVQGIPAESLSGKATIRNRALDYELEGKTLGGSFEIKGRYPGQKKDAPDEKGPRRGSFRLRGADLSRVATDIGFRSLAPLSGRLDASFDYDNDFSAGSGTVRLTGLRWGNSAVAPELTGSLILDDGIVRLTEFVGRVAGGELRARAQFRLGDARRNYFTISLNGADAKQLLGPFTDASLVEGAVTLVVHGRYGTETSGSGTLSLARGTLAGVQVADLNVPFTFATAPGGHGQFAIRDASVSAGSGRARADLTIDWGTTARVDGKIRFTELPLRALSAELGENSMIGNGRITGRFDLSGSNVRSVDDLTGTVIATLNNTSVKEVPVLRQITPFVNPSGLTKPFQAGDLRANLSKGVFRVQHLALANPAAQLFAEGTITTSGRVDLNVVAHTGTIGAQSAITRLFGLRVPVVGPVPVALLREVSDFLSNRTVRLTVNGTVSNPIVRVNVGALLSEQAVRFMLGRALPAEVAGALGYSSGLGSTGSNR